MNLWQKLNTATKQVKKDWGIKLPVFNSETAVVDLLLIEKGGYSSKHRHFQMHNILYVISGELLVRTHVKDEFKERILQVGQQILIKSGYVHQFEALEETICVEVSFVKLSEEDIHRLDKGGIKVETKQITG